MALDWRLFFITFGTLFVAELGDKTMFAVFSFASQNRNPWTVFIAASLALVAVTALSTFVGGVIGRFVPAQVIKLASGLIFLGVAVWILAEAIPEFIKYIQR